MRPSERKPFGAEGRPRPSGLGDSPLPPGSLEALAHLRRALESGTPWGQALLEAAGLWTAPEEVHRGRLLRYLVAGEAFDWPLLARRLAQEADGLIPATEREALLRSGRLPPYITQARFREALGVAKYRAYLNFWYGVVVERALLQAVRMEVRKERLSRCLPPSEGTLEEAFLRIYEERPSTLLRAFRQEVVGLPPGSEAEAKEFTYWLFKLRMRRSEKARLASDTRKGLEWLQRHRITHPWGPDQPL